MAKLVHIADPFDGSAQCGDREGFHTLTFIATCPSCLKRCPTYNDDKTEYLNQESAEMFHRRRGLS